MPSGEATKPATDDGPPYEWLTQQFADSPKLHLRFVIDVGSREGVGALGGAAPSLLDSNRRLYAVLKAKGYHVDYFEVPNGEHSPDTWRGRRSLNPTGGYGFVMAVPLLRPCHESLDTQVAESADAAVATLSADEVQRLRPLLVPIEARLPAPTNSASPV